MAKADIMAGRAYVSLFVKGTAFTKGLQKAKQELNKFGSELVAVGRQVLAVSAAGAIPFAAAAKVFANFDDAMRMVKAVSQSTDEEFRKLSETAKRLGATTSYTAVEVASLMTELGRAGFTASEIDVMTASVMNLARATGTDATLASGIMAATLRQFGLDATDAAKAADVLTTAANSTFNTVEGLGESLKYAGPVAKNLGLSLEDTVAILGTLGNVGIQGSEAGTALRRLGVITAASGKELREIFNISNIDAAGNLKPIIQIMDEIGKSIQGLPVEVQVSKMNEAFGLLGITSAQVLAGAADGTADLAEKLNGAAGSAAEAAKAMDAGIGGAFRIIMSALEGVGIAIGESISEPLKEIVDTGSSFLTMVTEWVSKNKEAVITFAKITASVGAFGAMLLGTGLALSGMSFAIGGILTGIGMATAIFSTVTAAIGFLLTPIGLLIAALVGGTIAWTQFTQSGRNAVSTLVSSVTTLFGNLRQTVSDTLGGIGQAIRDGNLSLAGQIAMVGLRLVFAQGLEAITNLFGESIGAIVGRILSGDIAGAWSALGSTILSTWANIGNGIVSIFTSASSSVVSLWRKTIDEVVNGMLSLAGQGGIFGAAFEQFSGVNVQKEMQRAKDQEAQRRSMGLTPQDDDIASQIAAGTYRDPGIAAMESRAQEAIASVQSVSQDMADAAAQALEDNVGNQTEVASGEVARLQAELDALRQQAAEKVASGRIGDPSEDEIDGYGSGDAFRGGSGRASVATNNLAALASLASGGSAQERQARAISAVKTVGEKQLGELEKIAIKLDNLGLWHP